MFCRLDRSVLDSSTLKRMCIDYQRYFRECFLQSSLDLKDKYDRIEHIATVLALLCIGIPKYKIISIFESIQKNVLQGTYQF